MPLAPPQNAATSPPPVVPESGRPALVERASSWIAAPPHSVWALVDQAVVSLVNFGTAVLVGRLCGPEQLGLFGLGLWTMMMVYAIAKALVWTPYTTKSPHMQGDDLRSFAGSSTFYVAIIAATTSLAMLLGAGLAAAFGSSAAFFGLFAAMAVYLPAVLCREHVRRLCMARLAIQEVLLFDLAAAAAQVIALVALCAAGVLSGGAALVALAASAIATVGWFAIRRSRFAFSWTRIRSDWRRNWPFSKWLAGGAAAVQGGEQGAKWFVSQAFGLVIASQLVVAQQIIQIVNPVVLGISNYFAPASANVFSEQGLPGLWKHTLRGTAWLIGFSALAMAFLITLGPLFASFVFNISPSDVDALLIASLSLGVFSTVVHLPIEFASLARSRGRLLFYTALIRLAANATVGVGLILWLGPVGVGFGMLIGNAISLFIQWASLAREVQHV